MVCLITNRDMVSKPRHPQANSPLNWHFTDGLKPQPSNKCVLSWTYEKCLCLSIFAISKCGEFFDFVFCLPFIFKSDSQAWHFLNYILTGKLLGILKMSKRFFSKEDFFSVQETLRKQAGSAELERYIVSCVTSKNLSV